MVLERGIENLLEQELSINNGNVDFQKIDRDIYYQKDRTQEENSKLGALQPDFCLYLSSKSHTPEINTIQSKERYKNFSLASINSYKDENIIINSKEDLINVFAFTNQKLRKAGITKEMERFFEFLNLLFLKLISEDDNKISESIPEYIKWESYKNKEGDELLNYINDIVIDKLEVIFNKQNKETLFTKLIIQDASALKQIIDKLDKLNLRGIQTDIKGDAFEYFIQQYYTSNNDLDEYFTPRHIVNFLVSKNFLTHSVLVDLKENTVYGSEISSNAKIAKMNMILTGDGLSNINQQGTLLNLEGTATSLYSLLDDNGNSQSIEHIVNSLNKKPTFRAYIIVPESILNNKELKNLRKYLLEEERVENTSLYETVTVTKKNVAVSKMYVTFKIIDKNFLPEYIYLRLKSQEGIQSIKDRSFGSVRQSLRFDDLCIIAIPNISKEEQKKMVNDIKKKYTNYIKYKKALNLFDISDSIV